VNDLVNAGRALLAAITTSPDLPQLLRSSEVRHLLDVIREALGHARPPTLPAAEHVTVQEYAAAHRLCTATVRAAFRDGRLDGIRIGKRAIRIRSDAVIAPPTTGRAVADAQTPGAIAERILSRGGRGRGSR
jgi:hypothetical protein